MSLLLLSLIQIFGENATQSTTTLTINKADLPKLTPSLSNRAEQLLIAICLKALENFAGELTDPDGNTVLDPDGNAIIYDNKELFELLKAFRWQSYYTQQSNNLILRESIVIHQFNAN